MNEWLRTVLFLPPQASTIAPSIDHLHYFVILTTMGGATFIALLAFYFIVRYRRVREPQPEEPPTTPGWMEGIIVGGLFSLFIAWWLIGFMQYVRLRVPPAKTYDIYVTAKQWMWKFGYADGRHTVAELYVPTGRAVKLLMTSRDVIHSLYVPDFRLKQDVIPGRYTTLWFEVKEPGRHDIFCAEYCGTNHSMMRAQVIALEPADFERWLASAPDAVAEESPAPFRQLPAIVETLGPSKPTSLARLGEQVAAQEGCLRCHTLDGAPHIGPTWAGVYHAEVPLEGGAMAIADDAYLTESMMDPRAKIRRGFKAVMPSYLGRLRPAEVAAILELIKSIKDTPPPAAPFSQGLPPPNVPALPPMEGEVTVGPEGQRGAP
jgi:cytochrome c oxidase subunit 2